jgi:hypothetical protein
MKSLLYVRPADSARRHLPHVFAICLAWVLAASPAAAQFVSNTQIEPFVVGLIPVVGPSGAVGGVSIDAAGVLSRSSVDASNQLRDARQRALAPIDFDLAATSAQRKISLRRLSAAIDERRQKREPLADVLQNLAGLTRVQFVFVYPDQQDIVLAGPAEGWRVDDRGNVVGQTTGQPVLQLDDLLVALRTAKAAATDRGISCSIDPSPDGLKKIRPLLNSRNLNDALVRRLEQTLGPQQITVTGVPPGSHFARVLVAADFLMKRLGMNFEPAPIDELPSYMEMLAVRSAPAPKNAMPRWWMAPHYDALLKDEAGLAWQLRGSGVQTLTEEGYLISAAAHPTPGREDTLAKKWAAAMTSHYDSLAKSLPVFAELRNCIDLAVVGALLVKEKLPTKARCDFALLLDEKKLAVAEYHVPQTVDSKASLIRKGQSQILSLSGGVQVDSWSVLNRVEIQPDLAEARQSAASPESPRWWWD